MASWTEITLCNWVFLPNLWNWCSHQTIFVCAYSQQGWFLTEWSLNHRSVAFQFVSLHLINFAVDISFGWTSCLFSSPISENSHLKIIGFWGNYINAMRPPPCFWIIIFFDQHSRASDDQIQNSAGHPGSSSQCLRKTIAANLCWNFEGC